MSAARGPVFWIIETESGWLLRRFWYDEYDTISIHGTEAEAAARAEKLNLAAGGM